MRAAMSQMNLSARAYHRTRSVKLARTIADLAGSEDNRSAHLAETLHALRSSEVDDGVIQVHKICFRLLEYVLHNCFKGFICNASLDRPDLC